MAQADKKELPKFVEEGDLEKYQAEQRSKGRYHPCDNSRYRLKYCMLESECCKAGVTPRKCLDSKDPRVPEECFLLYYQFTECKRSLVDRRSRLRGRRYD